MSKKKPSSAMIMLNDGPTTVLSNELSDCVPFIGIYSALTLRLGEGWSGSYLLVTRWLATLGTDIHREISWISHGDAMESKVRAHLERMGFEWR